jgi:hypothetical protein
MKTKNNPESSTSTKVVSVIPGGGRPRGLVMTYASADASGAGLALSASPRVVEVHTTTGEG